MFEERIFAIKERIACACRQVNRNPDSVALIAVSKGRSVETVQAVIRQGISAIGENRVQEAAEKYRVLRTSNSLPVRQAGELPTIQWHMVGHLQSNKVGQAVKIFDLIHSVDSLKLAQEIDTQAHRIHKIQEVLIEVKTSPEATKFGISPEGIIAFIKEIITLKNIRIKGLMTLAPAVADPEKTRPYFRILRELRDKFNSLPPATCNLQQLSMGMSDDFEVAIEEGATMVRLGRAVFGA